MKGEVNPARTLRIARFAEIAPQFVSRKSAPVFCCRVDILRHVAARPPIVLAAIDIRRAGIRALESK